MLFVIDTNIFVAALSATSPFHWVIESLLDEKFDFDLGSNFYITFQPDCLYLLGTWAFLLFFVPYSF